ncbi:MAG: hypothetical protein ACJA1B_001231, partial [Polaribacter sp.]
MTIVKAELALLQQRAAVKKPLKPALNMTLCYSLCFIFFYSQYEACLFNEVL